MYKKIFSEERLNNYKLTLTGTDDEIIARYLWNITLGKAFYPAIAILEVNLRNNIYNAISHHILKNWLDENNTWLLQPEVDQILKAKKNLLKLQKPAIQGQIISHLSFGFWVGLFKKQYKPNIWNKPKVFDDAFPHFSTKIKTMDRVSIVEPELRKILILRNRFFHHEPIFNHPRGLPIVFNDIVKMRYIIQNQMNIKSILQRLCNKCRKNIRSLHLYYSTSN